MADIALWSSINELEFKYDWLSQAGKIEKSYSLGLNDAVVDST